MSISHYHIYHHSVNDPCQQHRCHAAQQHRKQDLQILTHIRAEPSIIYDPDQDKPVDQQNGIAVTASCRQKGADRFPRINSILPQSFMKNQGSIRCSGNQVCFFLFIFLSSICFFCLISPIFMPDTTLRSAWSSHTYRINCRFQAHRHGPSLEAFLLPLRRPAPLL